MVDLEPHGDVDQIVLADPQARPAEGDAERPVSAAVEAEARVLALPHRPHIANLGRGHKQPHAGIAHPERGQLPQLLSQIKPQRSPADHRIDPLGPLQILGPKHARGMGSKGLPKRIDVRLLQLQPGSSPMPTKAAQMLRASLQPGKQIEATDTAPRPTPRALTIERNHDHRPVMPLNHPRSDDPDHTGMPVVPSNNQPRSFPQVLGQIPQRRLGGVRNLPLSSPPLTISPIQLNSDLLSPRLVFGQKQLHPSIGPIEPPRSIDPRPNRKPRSLSSS